MVKNMRIYFISILLCLILTGCTLGEEPVGFKRDVGMSLVNDMLCISMPKSKVYYLSVVSIKSKDGSGLRNTITGNELIAIKNKRCIPMSKLPVSERKEYNIHYILLSKLVTYPSFRRVVSIKVLKGRILNLPLDNQDYVLSFIYE